MQNRVAETHRHPCNPHPHPPPAAQSIGSIQHLGRLLQGKLAPWRLAARTRPSLGMRVGEPGLWHRRGGPASPRWSPQEAPRPRRMRGGEQQLLWEALVCVLSGLRARPNMTQTLPCTGSKS